MDKVFEKAFWKKAEEIVKLLRKHSLEQYLSWLRVGCADLGNSVWKLIPNLERFGPTSIAKCSKHWCWNLRDRGIESHLRFCLHSFKGCRECWFRWFCDIIILQSLDSFHSSKWLIYSANNASDKFVLPQFHSWTLLESICYFHSLLLHI